MKLISRRQDVYIFLLHGKNLYDCACNISGYVAFSLFPLSCIFPFLRLSKLFGRWIASIYVTAILSIGL